MKYCPKRNDISVKHAAKSGSWVEVKEHMCSQHVNPNHTNYE